MQKSVFKKLRLLGVLFVIAIPVTLTMPDVGQAGSLAELRKAANKKGKIGLFGRFEFRESSFTGVSQWVRVLKKMKKQKRELHACAQDASKCRSNLAAHWRRIIVEARGLSKAKQLQAVNRHFNTWSYKLDRSVYKKEEYWATPIQFMQNSGDCEDYSITKFYALLELGWDNDDMRIVAVEDGIGGIGHAVLVVKYKNDNIILDNKYNRMLSDKFMKRYVPHYSVNETTKWTHIPSRR